MGNLESLRCRGEGFRRDVGLNARVEPCAVPVNRRALLRIEVSDLGSQPADGSLSRECTGQRGFADAAFLRHESDDGGLK